MLMDNTIWHDISHFLPFFVLFNSYIFTNHWLILFQGHQIVLIISFIYMSMPADNVTWHARVVLFFKTIAQK